MFYKNASDEDPPLDDDDDDDDDDDGDESDLENPAERPRISCEARDASADVGLVAQPGKLFHKQKVGYLLWMKNTKVHSRYTSWYSNIMIESKSDGQSQLIRLRLQQGHIKRLPPHARP